MGSFELLQASLPGNHHWKRIAILFFFSRNEMIIQRISACLVEKLSSFLLPCRPTKRKINIYSGPRDFYWLHMQATNPQEISIWSHLTSTLLQSSPTMRHLGFKYLEWIPECQCQTLHASQVQRSQSISASAVIHRCFTTLLVTQGIPAGCPIWGTVKFITVSIHFLPSPTTDCDSETCGVIRQQLSYCI